MAVTEQRHAPGHHGTRLATYRFDSVTEWRASRVIDVSYDRAALELYQPDADDARTGWLYLGVEPADDPGFTVRTMLRGDVQLENGRVIVIVGFGPLASHQRQVLHDLVTLRALV
jgi:hypothetical protein